MMNNLAKGENLIKENDDQTYEFDDGFLEQEMKNSCMY
jgi:hypothetical protein